jgi:hypothetical protein
MSNDKMVFPYIPNSVPQVKAVTWRQYLKKKGTQKPVGQGT